MQLNLRERLEKQYSGFLEYNQTDLLPAIERIRNLQNSIASHKKIQSELHLEANKEIYQNQIDDLGERMIKTFCESLQTMDITIDDLDLLFVLFNILDQYPDERKILGDFLDFYNKRTPI